MIFRSKPSPLRSPVYSFQFTAQSETKATPSRISSLQFTAQSETTAIPSWISSLQFPVYSSDRDQSHHLFDLQSTVSTLQLCQRSKPHCKDLHPKYISTTTLEMYPTSVSGAQLPDVAYYISSTSPLHLSVVIITTI